MDPITLLATASAIWSGVKKASEIDKQYLAILKDIMLLCIGAVGGIVGRKGAYSAINAMKDKE